MKGLKTGFPEVLAGRELHSDVGGPTAPGVGGSWWWW